MGDLGGILRSWNGYDVVLLQKPAQCHLSRSLTVTITDQPQQCHNRPQCVVLRPAERCPKATDANRTTAIEILPSKRAAGERLISDQGDAKFPAGVQDPIGLRPPMQQGVLNLIGCKWNTALGKSLVRGAHLSGG